MDTNTGNKGFLKNGLRFSCRRCGWCCTFPGGRVYASRKEYRDIADHLGTGPDEFIRRYTEIRDGQRILQSRPDGPCIFYDNGCTVYPVRPVQCRTFPFWPHVIKNRRAWNREARDCPGMNSGRLWSAAEIQKKAGDYRWAMVQAWSGMKDG